MNTGTYLATDNGLVKVSDAIPSLARPVYFNRGGVPNYDPSARRWFQSKEDKRLWLKENKLREGGIINPKKRLEGHYRNAAKPTATQRIRKQQAQQWVQSQGGTEGIITRLKQKGVI
jgi:hypothetical protein